MISYFDTSIILPALSAKHPLHQICYSTLSEASAQGSLFTTTLHTFAELYHHLTKPTKLDIHFATEEVQGLLLDRLPQMLGLIELTEEDYRLAIRRCAQANLVSAVIYDALHFQAAIKCGASVLYTDNTKDFNRLLTPDDALRIRGVR